MLSKQVVFSKQSLGFVVTAAAVAMGLLVGVVGPGRAQDAKPAAPQKQWKDPMEFDVANAPTKEADPVKRLALVEKWKQMYPATEFVDERQTLYLQTYMALVAAKQPYERQAFDEAQEILKSHPMDVGALADIIQLVTAIKPAPSPADLDAAEKVAWMFIDDTDKIFAPSNKPAGTTDADWAKTKAAIPPFAEKVLLAIYAARKDDKRAVEDITKLLHKDGTLAAGSYQLGTTMLAVIKAANRPDDQPPAFFHIARAAAYSGPGALPAAQQKQILDYLTRLYVNFHGSDQGLPDVLTLAKNNVFPPADFKIKSTVDIANEQAAKDAAERDKDPVIYTWQHAIKENLLKDGGDAFFEMSLKDALLPPPKDDGTAQWFKGKIISMTPETKPKEVVVAIEKADVADAKLVFDPALPGKMEAGEVLEFQGVAKSFTKEPFMITFDVDAKEQLHGWTGKNTPASKGGGAKGPTPGAKGPAPATKSPAPAPKATPPASK